MWENIRRNMHITISFFFTIFLVYYLLHFSRLENMETKLEGHSIMQFEEEIRRQKDQFKNNESFRLENLKEKIVKIEKEYEEKLLNENIELEEVCNDKLWKLVEIIENERVMMQEQFTKEFEENEKILEKQFYNKVQVLMIKMQEIEEGKVLNFGVVFDCSV